MKLPPDIVEIAKKKAAQSQCRYRVSAIGFNANGDIVAKTFNRHRHNHTGGGLHAEMLLMRCAKRKRIRTILICRIGGQGDLLPIRACDMCLEKAAELGIKIHTVS